MTYPYATHKWVENKSYSLGEVVRANPASGNTLAFKCIDSGVSGTASDYANFEYNEPLFPRLITHTVVDGSVTWEAFEPLSEELQRLTPSAVIDLFEIALDLNINGTDEILRFHSGKNEITRTIKFNNIEYPAVPIEVNGFEFTSNGVLPRPTLKVGNVNNAITSLMLRFNPLAAKVRRIRTFVKFIDATNFAEPKKHDTADPDAKIVETWYIDRVASENQQYVEFELTPKLDLTNLALPRRTIEEFCPWVYRGNRECPYVGDACFTVNDRPLEGGTLAERKAADVCGKRLSSCQARFPDRNALPFGGFYGARLQA